MSKDKTDAERMAELETMVLEQADQLKALRALLAERTEAKLEPAQIVLPNRDQEIEAKTQKWLRERAEREAADKRAIEAGEFKFMVCIFARSSERDQFMQIKQVHNGAPAPWDCSVRPTHPWLLVGVDAPDLETARLKAAEKYNRCKGIRRLSGDVMHTIYQVDAQGRPVKNEEDLAKFRGQLAETGATEMIAA